ncbi:nuclear transport factor 2 family protein [Endozoicomonas numazuensis]|uniref:Steroid delta-isomerase n=1 Tax=Endozoicomonas numazuensis TaxID=1137799 RepID=A0A081NMK6_9GAMM|nr:nuclear transport factor 2 family protein [Endozoicomonas numazuensis]KEQ19679.1 steroid delta-isomerase [Endozoicomonas numazuensis]
MVDTKVIKSVLEKYVELVDVGDIDGILNLYDDNAVVEDPVGSDPHVGIKAIEDFYRNGLGQAEASANLIGPVRTTSANEGAMAFQVKIKMEGMNMLIDTLDVMELNDDGKVTSMKAYWSYEDNVEQLA